ncbi:MAG: hypothetical protein GY720_23200 [bacterium]|nr:hypothetical protein [bacterium]
MSTRPAWAALRAEGFPNAWIDYLEGVDSEGGQLSVTPEFLGGLDVTPEDRTRHSDLPAAADRLLQGLATIAWVQLTTTRHCPICDYEVPEDHHGDTCPNPSREPHAFIDEDEDAVLIERRSYSRTGIARRYVGWMLALHGMNTVGSWQESFNWRVSTSYGRMVPVAIHKYGVVRPGVLRRARHEELRDELVGRIRRASEEALQVTTDPRPDVVAHSFGTLLLGKALHANSDLKVGRIVTLGCILRPDFDWATLVERGQVEAVLNNYGTEDQWAKRAHFTIPDSGPAGRRGFDFYEEKWPEQYRAANSRPVFNVPAAGFEHSDFFDDELPRPTTLEQQFESVWEPFLTTRNVADIAKALELRGSHASWPAEKWRSSPWPKRAVTGGRGAALYTYADR